MIARIAMRKRERWDGLNSQRYVLRAGADGTSTYKKHIAKSKSWIS
jgi:hypothetical protein